MAFAASMLAVFGTFGLVLWNMAASDTGQLGWGTSQMIHAPYPWLLVGALTAGAVAGLVNLVRRPAWFKWPVVGLECVVAAAVLWYVTAFSWLPQRELLVSVGDSFPAYHLAAHDGSLRTFTPGSDGDRVRRLYIFYRGDW